MPAIKSAFARSFYGSTIIVCVFESFLAGGADFGSFAFPTKPNCIMNCVCSVHQFNVAK